MLNRSIEIHDSVLASVQLFEREVRLHFSSVYLHESEGVPGCDAGSGWVQKAMLRIREAKVEGAFSEFPVDLGGGQTHMGNKILQNEIPVPLDHQGEFELRLQAMWQEQVVVSFRGSGARLELLGEPEYAREFRP
jgi:hypothetical protein